jgi:Xaa-Pro aminopeptidase
MNDKITQLRARMAQHQLDAYLVPDTDPHQSEYLAPYWAGRSWISGFDGSAGTLVVTPDFAGLWTDSRYFIQAAQQLQGTGIQLMKLPPRRTPNQVDWLADNLPEGSRVGVAQNLLSMAQARHMRKQWSPRKIELLPMADLLVEIWDDRPPLSQEAIFELNASQAGESRAERLTRIRDAMRGRKLDYHLITSLDDLAWTFNLRGADIPYNPLAFGFAVLGLESCVLCMDAERMEAGLAERLQAEGISLRPYDAIEQVLQTELEEGKSLLLSPVQTNLALVAALPEGVRKVEGSSLPSHMKARKNPSEVAHIRRAMEKDGVALVRFSRWLEQQMADGVTLNEADAQEKLHAFRAAQPDFQGDSFHPIAGYGPHGAIVHYAAQRESALNLKPHSFFLLDSGGQYLDGTTDITRTFSLGPLSEEEKHDYTLVLKGMIALSRAVFPEGTTGGHLDVLARAAMWKEGIDYGHGTGHGVGFFLNVHEGPQRIGQGVSGPFKAAFQPGMVTSNEPGIYREGKHGIRIENLILVVPGPQTDFGNFLQFETLTLCPIDTYPILPELLQPEEVEWLNAYHQEVYKRLAPQLEEAERAWLEEKTKAV